MSRNNFNYFALVILEFPSEPVKGKRPWQNLP